MRYGGGGLAKIFPAAGGLGREEESQCPTPSHSFLVSCSLGN